MTYEAPADLCAVLVSRESTFDERNEAVLRLAREAFDAGYEECAIECRKADHVAKRDDPRKLMTIGP